MILRQRPPSLCLLFIEEKVRTFTPILDSPVNRTSYMTDFKLLECTLNSSASLSEECLHDQASIGLEIGANFGTNYRAPGQLAVEKKVGEYSHCTGCHVSRSSTRRAVKYQNKSGCFLFLQNVRASNHGSLLIKYLNVRRKIGAKKSHQ